MLRRSITQPGPVIYQSPLLSAIGCPHAFTTRIGGVSPAPFDSLNFGNPSGSDLHDDAQNIQENYRRIQSALHASARPILRVHQSHGCEIAADIPARPFDFSRKADAIILTDSRSLASVRTADCVPVLLAAQNASSAAAVHAGWRGVIAAIIPKTVAALRDLSPNQPIIAAIGPHIGPAAFEVGPEVLAEFARVFGIAAPTAPAPDAKRSTPKGYVDLGKAIELQLITAGLSPTHIDRSDCCTFSNPAEFFSHRRDKGITGRMAAFIGLP